MSRRGDAVDGVLVVDKPMGLTSNDVLQQLRRKLNAARGGHTGSLDPLATGVLPLCFGEATKFSQQVLDADKTYLTRARLGVRTSTSDADGETVAERAVPQGLDEYEIESVLAGFRGPQQQVPSMYSALKYNGTPLYVYARQGQTLPREARRIVVYELSLLGYERESLLLRVRCSKGTYIRTLVDDLGEELGCGAHVAELRREAAGAFTLDEALAPGEIKALDRDCARARLRPADRLLSDVASLNLDSRQALSISNGQAVTMLDSELDHYSGQCLFRLYAGERFLGLGEWNQGVVRPKRMVRTDT